MSSSSSRGPNGSLRLTGLLTALLLALLASGCGGGGGGNDQPADTWDEMDWDDGVWR